jgi:hypothetical protein
MQIFYKSNPSVFCAHSYHRRVKCKDVPVHAVNAHGEWRCAAPLILNLGTRWRWQVSFTPGPLYIRGNSRRYASTDIDEHLGSKSVTLHGPYLFSITTQFYPWLYVIANYKHKIQYSSIHLKFKVFLVNKTNRCTKFQFYWYYYSTCFGQKGCPKHGE